jgi:hypothetical protein
MNRTWETPVAEELKMDAEIGSYQEDSDPLQDPQFVSAEAEQGLSVHARHRPRRRRRRGRAPVELRVRQLPRRETR